MTSATPHFNKLNETLKNKKLPSIDKPRIEKAMQKYQQLIEELDKLKKVKSRKKILTSFVDLLNVYKTYIQLDLVFDSKKDFLYRSKGQLKIESSILEEFIPWLILHPCLLPELKKYNLSAGPKTTFSAVRFVSSVDKPNPIRMQIKSKNQDFAITRKLYLKASHDVKFNESTTNEMHLAYVAVEIKTNLDKTMFQEACATASDVKSGVSGSRYFLLCEWLDMKIDGNTSSTDIDEVFILREVPRLDSSTRKNYSSYEGRKKNRDQYKNYLVNNPIRLQVIDRFVSKIKMIVANNALKEKTVLKRGFF